MITFLSGGAETLKLIRGMQAISEDAEIGVITPMADAVWTFGGHAAPECDNTLFLFAGILNTARWQGVRGDTATTSNALARLGRPEYLPAGEQERALRIARAEMLRNGLSLTDACECLCGALGINATILPPTDTPQALWMHGPGIEPGSKERVHLLDYRRDTWDLPVHEVTIESEEPPVATNKALDLVKKSEAIILGPGPSWTSLLPLLACGGMRAALKEAFVITIAPEFPFVPEGDVLAEECAARLQDISRLHTDLFVQDLHTKEPDEEALSLNTRLTSRHRAESLAWDIFSVLHKREQ